MIELLQTTYCERIGSGPFGEPLNALSNLAFVIAAVYAARRVRTLPDPGYGIRLLPWLLFLVASGSMLYHTYRSPLTYLLDVLPLAAFLVFSVSLFLRKIRVNAARAVLAGAAFLGIQVALLILVPNDFLNGSTPYLVAFVFFPPMLSLTSRRYHDLVWNLALIAGLFTLALVFRTVDLSLCPWLPMGTHFLWHLTAAAAAYYVVRLIASIELIDHGSQGK